MKIIVTMPVRNEAWVLGLSARAVLRWADEIVIGLHACTDRSAEIALDIDKEFPGRVTIREFPGETWTEMQHRQELLGTAWMRGATHIGIVDADEVLTANLVAGCREQFEKTPKGSILQPPWLCLRGGIDQYHAAGVWSEQMVSFGFVDEPDLHWSSKGRAGYDFHHRHPMGRYMAPLQPLRPQAGGVMHLQFVSGRRLRAKQALYKLTELLRWPGREPVHLVDERYNLAVYGRYHRPTSADLDHVADTLRGVPAAWWDGYDDLMRHFHPREIPWQEAEVHRLLAEHGRQKFAGLDLFGLDSDSAGA